MTFTNHAAERPVRRRRTWIALLTALAALVAAPLIPAAGVSGATPTLESRKAEAPTYITLITGDRVKVISRSGQRELVTFEPGGGSGSTGAITSYTAGHVYVVPMAAQAAVLSGRLDRTLFDITTLLAEKRDDASSASLPVIVTYAGARAAATARARQAAVPGLGGTGC